MANKQIDKQIDQLDGADPTDDSVKDDDYVPSYRVYQNSRIPVSKAMGPFWRNRQKEGLAILKNSGVKDRWDEAISYYQNDQGGKSNGRRRLDEVSTGSETEEMFMTENIVFSNVSAIVPSIYAKNPDVEVVDRKGTNEDKAAMYERLVEELFRIKTSPGINLKPKMRRATVMAMLTNIAYFELGYVKREDSSQAAVDDLTKLSEELQAAKTTKEIAEIEGKLLALEERVNMLSEAGPTLKIKPPDAVILDPNCETCDPVDCQYVIVADYVNTSFLQAVYGEKDEDGNWKSIYKPTHVVDAKSSGVPDISGHDETITSFSLIGNEPDYKKFGYSDEDSYKQACRTKVWMVWDKTTRRVMMFHDEDWSWPIWVWDDPYNLTRFYPIFSLSFYTDPAQRYARSEVMYYLDQQDEINRVNNERARMRHWAASKVFVNTGILPDASAVETFLSRKTRDKVFGLKLGDGQKIGDAISAFPAPSTALETLFDTGPLIQSINRLSSVTPILQNEQFKTNTTNKAIESYTSSTQTRLDEKIDAIEDVLGDIGQALIEMCIQFMTEEQVVALVGEDVVTKAGGWSQDMRPDQFLQSYNFNTVGGSTLKPTSKVKKDQAMNLGQVLGQFAQASPAVLLIVLKMMERAFNEDVVVTQQEWDMIIQSIEQAAQGPAPSANGGGRPPEAGQQAQGQGQGVSGEQIVQAIDSLPQEVRQKVGQLIAQGAPFGEILSQLANAGA